MTDRVGHVTRHLGIVTAGSVPLGEATVHVGGTA